MNVADAVRTRRSIRAYLPDPVDPATLRSLLTDAARAPSGGNLQPWRIYLLSGAAMSRFRAHRDGWDAPQSPAYEIYPPGLKEPYRSSRFKCGEQMYRLLGIAREDKAGRLKRLAENFDFFGAPAGIFCFVDRQMGPPQWADLGIYLQTVMLLAREAGLDTCPQEAWATCADMVSAFVGAPEELMLFCGMAIGHRDPEAPVNGLVTEREPAETWLTEL